MGISLVESFELLVDAEQLAPRLDAAAAALAQLPGLEDERQWLTAARARLEPVRAESHGDLLNRALRLPELEGSRGERAKLIQGGVADKFEELQAGIPTDDVQREDNASASSLLDILDPRKRVQQRAQAPAPSTPPPSTLRPPRAFGPGRQAAAPHRVWLSRAKTFGKWCVKQKMLRENPFSDVEPTGKRVYGADKPRHTVDESRKLRAYIHAHTQDQGAVLTLGYQLLGPRASELVRLDVRDLDDGGRLMQIGRTKTLAGRRRLLIPDELAPLLLAIAAGRPPDAPLFAGAGSRRWPAGRRWSRFSVYDNVIRVCKAAGVPPLGPQALRRTQATLATDAGATGLMVAQHLGHAVADTAPVVTRQHYIGRSEAGDAQAERALRVIAGGKR